jgi:hypothetical protein
LSSSVEGEVRVREGKDETFIIIISQGCDEGKGDGDGTRRQQRRENAVS